MRRLLKLSAVALLCCATLGVIAIGKDQQAHAAASPAPALHVSGNALVDANGSVVRLHGVDHSGTEYNCIQGNGIFDNGQPNQAFVNNILAEHANSVRIPLNEDCWLAINGAPTAYSGTNYQNAIQQWVSLLEQNGITPILSLFWNAPGTQKATGQQPMPDEDHSVTFWQQVAAAYANQPQVIYDLYNEPYPGSWACWRDGGSACSGDVSFAVAGMQQLVNTVRAAGAANVVMLGCLDYSNTCNGYGGSWQQYAPTDPDHNLAASVHVYLGNPCVTTTCWDSEWKPILQAGYPIVNGEFGAYKYDGTQYSPSFGQTLLDWFDANHVSGYDAWTWNDWGYSSSDAEALITSPDGSTLSPWGQWVQQQYATRFGSGGTPTPTPTATATQTSTPTPTPSPTPPPGTPAFRAAANATSGTSTTALTVSRPSSVQSGDVEFATLALFGNQGAITAPSGWAQDGTTVSGTTGKMDVAWFHHVAGASEPASYTFAWQNGARANLSLDAYSGVSTTTPEDVSAVKHGAGRRVVVPSLMPSVSGDVQIALAATSVGSWGATPGGWVQDSNDGGHSNAAYRRSAPLTAGKATPTAYILSHGKGDWAVLTIALAPAG